MKRRHSSESPAAVNDAPVLYCLVDCKGPSLWRAKTSHSIDLRPFWFNTHSPKSEETLASPRLQQLCNWVDVDIWRAPQSQEKTLHQWPWCFWWHKSKERKRPVRYAGWAIDRWQQLNSPQNLRANQTLRLAHSSVCAAAAIGSASLTNSCTSWRAGLLSLQEEANIYSKPSNARAAWEWGPITRRGRSSFVGDASWNYVLWGIKY